MRILLFLAGLSWSLAQCAAQDAGLPAKGQSAADPQTKPTQITLDHNRHLERRFLPNIVRDQATIWTSPFRMKAKDGIWLLPAAALTGEIMHRDAYLYSRLRLSGDGSGSSSFSDAGMLAMGGLVGASYVIGRVRSIPQARETGILGTEALVNSLAVNYALKYSLGRQRPFAGDGRGSFFNTGKDSESFPSAHAMLTWSMASVLAHEYPGPLTQIGVYGLASAVSIARVTGRKHFPSDVLMGSALGWAIGRQVYRSRHDESLGGASIGTIIRENDGRRYGSPYVPLDHWAYQAFDRLTALGVLHSGFAGLRPWTRSECARLVAEAAEESDEAGETEYAVGRPLIDALRKEFGSDSAVPGAGAETEAHLESIYYRFTGISGPPLADGYHFGETIPNDYGRPYQQGANSIAGLSGWARYGTWAFYLRGEYQHAPFAPALSTATRTHISQVDFSPLTPGVPFSQLDRLHFLDAYVALNLRDWQISVGRQSLWWGQEDESSFMLSNNAEPILMARVSRVSPLVLPGFLRFLGPLRGEIFFGKLTGHSFIRTTVADIGPPLANQPLIHGGKLSFKPTKNFEFGVSVTTIFAGPGEPLNFRTFLRSLGLSNTQPGQLNDPGDRRSGFDLRYRLPWVRNWLTLYNDSFAEDEISPLAFPRRSAMSPGLMLARLPGLAKLDLRAEGFYTDLPGLRPAGFLYFNNKYLNGYTNAGNLLGHWIGRQGSGYLLKSRYWISARNVLSFEYKDSRISDQFVPGGGRIQAASMGGVFRVRKDIEVSGRMQMERWRFSPLAPVPRSDVATMIQLTFFPDWKVTRVGADK